MHESSRLTAFRDLAAGRGVKRGRHDLRIDGKDVSESGLLLQILMVSFFFFLPVRGVALPKVEKVRKQFKDRLKAESPLEK